MSRIRLNYSNYDAGYTYYTFLNNALEGSLTRTNEIKDEYSKLDYSIFDTSSFPLNSYIDDLYQSLKTTQEILEVANELAKLAKDTFTDAENAIEADINKFKNRMEELFSNISFGGFHFESEKMVYWEPGTHGYTPQGYTETDKYKVVSAYKGDSNSRLYYYDKKTGEFIGYVELNNKAHVGGITYDPDDELMFITGDDGDVNCYDHRAIERALEYGKNHFSDPMIMDLNRKEYKGIEIDCDINIEKELKTKDAATVYYQDGKLYVSTFREKGDLVSYDIKCDRDNNEKINLDTGRMHVISHNTPSATQGISIFERDGKKYAAFARSAKYSPSSVDIYELNDNGSLGKFSGSKVIDHEGLEGIKVNKDGSVTGIFEYEGATTLDEDIDYIIDNGVENPYDRKYANAADFWNKHIKHQNNSSYQEAKMKESLDRYYDHH